MDEVDPIAGSAYRLGDIYAHGGEVTLTERDPVVLAVVTVEDSLIGLGAINDTGDTTNRIRRWVVRVESEEVANLGVEKTVLSCRFQYETTVFQLILISNAYDNRYSGDRPPSR